METLVLEVEARAGQDGSARRWSRGGRMPGVVYGAGEASILISADSHDFGQRIRAPGSTHLISSSRKQR